MAKPLPLNTADFERRRYAFEGREKTVLVSGSGPAVVVLHEVYGFTPTVARLCRWIRDAGHTVYAPILFGAPNAGNPEHATLGGMLGICISREFNLFASGRSSPVVDWLKPLARRAHEECGGPGVGVIGMCLTGGFALSMAVDPVVLAPVLSEPSLPFLSPGGVDISPAELALVKARADGEGLRVQGYRFAGDRLCRPARFARYEAELGEAFEPSVLPDDAGNPLGMKKRGMPPHSVFTADLIDADGEPTRQAIDKLLAFFRERLLTGAVAT